MTNRLCFFVGSSTSFNVRLDLQHYAWMLQDEFKIDVITTNSAPFEGSWVDTVSFYGTGCETTPRGEVRALKGYLKENNPIALVHVTRSELLPLLVVGITKIRGIPVVYRYGADEFYTYRIADGWRKAGYLFRNNALGRISLGLSSSYMVFGPTGKRRLIKRGCNTTDIVQLPPPFDPDRIRSATNEEMLSSVPNDRAIVLYVGRRIQYKGFDFIVDMIPKLLEHRSDLHFVFVGGGDRQPDLSEWASDHVSVVGRVDPESIGAYFNVADLLVHPSFAEAFGRVIVEAQLARTRTLGRDIGDVTVATENTFSSEAEFVERVCSFEKLPLEDGERFSRERLQPRYLLYFRRFLDR